MPMLLVLVEIGRGGIHSCRGLINRMDQHIPHLGALPDEPVLEKGEQLSRFRIRGRFASGRLGDSELNVSGQRRRQRSRQFAWVPRMQPELDRKTARRVDDPEPTQNAITSTGIRVPIHKYPLLALQVLAASIAIIDQPSVKLSNKPKPGCTRELNGSAP